MIQLDNAIARAMLKTLLEELSSVPEVSIEVQLSDWKAREGKPVAILTVRFPRTPQGAEESRR